MAYVDLHGDMSRSSNIQIKVPVAHGFRWHPHVRAATSEHGSQLCMPMWHGYAREHEKLHATRLLELQLTYSVKELSQIDQGIVHLQMKADRDAL